MSTPTHPYQESNEAVRELTAERDQLRRDVAELTSERNRMIEELERVRKERAEYLEWVHSLIPGEKSFTVNELADLKKNGIPFERAITEIEQVIRGRSDG